MAKAYICDRCGRTFPEKNLSAFVESPLFTDPMYRAVDYADRPGNIVVRLGNIVENPDLCPVCLLKLKAFMTVRKHELYPVSDGMVGWQNFLSNALHRPVAPVALSHEIAKANPVKDDDCGLKAKVLVMDEVSHGGPIECLWDLGDVTAPVMAFDIFKTLAHEMEGQLFRAAEIMGDDDIHE